MTVKMTAKEIKHDCNVSLKTFNERIIRAKKDLNDNYITLADYLNEIREAGLDLSKSFQELLDCQE